MVIEQLLINHLKNPLGFDLTSPTLSYVVSQARGRRQERARVEVSLREDFSLLVYDSKPREDIQSTGFPLPIKLLPQTRYYWRVTVWDETGDRATSPVQWFETSRTVGQEKADWQAKWITPEAPAQMQAVVFQDLTLSKPVVRSRGYMVGLGLYELYVNGEKQGEECLLPGFCDYDSWIGYQTFDLPLKEGENRVELMLGDGWYKGWYGLRQNHDNYGDRLAALCQIQVWYEDGTTQIFGTDASWRARRSQVVASGIYPGETLDMTVDTGEIFSTRELSLGYERLCPRLSPPILVHERIKPIEVIHSPKGETILDMGQNMVGWISFYCDAPKGSRIHLQMGEILQDGCFYNENLRSAKAEFIYVSDGVPRQVRQHFTFYGFRYVKVEGMEVVDPEKFEGLVIHSKMEELGRLTTSNSLVNQLISNARWGMKGNFLDVPTDCPQRDERYGWTGDAQIFSGTACYFCDTDAFYTKYGRDIYSEQKKLGGSVPDVVPVCNYPGDASTAWGDAATVIPWNVYLHFGDKGILSKQYQSMKDWVEYMYREDEKDGGRRLWLSGTHYADWLALDGSYPGGVFGATEPGFVASVYYYYSTLLLSKAAHVLEKAEDASYYLQLAQEIRSAIWREYFTASGRLSIDTMTAYVLVLAMELCPDEEAVCRARKGLLNKLKKNFYHLETGFVGTPLLCRVLSEHGMNDLAYDLLLQRGYPSWLYEVLMGATTVWERWNSVNPDGKISGTEMNSLNHYSYGAIVEWMFRDMVGIIPLEEGAGFKRFRLSPRPCYRLEWARGSLKSAAGLILSEWEIREGKLFFHFQVPFDAEAELVLPDARAEKIQELLEGQRLAGERARQEGNDVVLCLPAGEYRFAYEPSVPYRKIYSLDSPLKELMENPKTLEILKREYLDKFEHIPFIEELCTLEEFTWGPFSCISKEERERLDKLLRAVE